MTILGLCFVPVREWSLTGAFQLVLAAVLAVSLGSRLRQYLRLRDFNGPVLAGFSRLWLVQTVWSGKAYLHFWDVTRKHGLFIMFRFSLSVVVMIRSLSINSL